MKQMTMKTGEMALAGALQRLNDRPSNDLLIDMCCLQSGEAGHDNDWENDTGWDNAGVWGQQD